MSWISALVQSISIFDPGFGRSIVRASEAEIAQVEMIAGRSLPADYADFLRTMGRYDGGLLFEERASADVRDVIRFCKGLLSHDPHKTFTRYLPISIGFDADTFALNLSTGLGPYPIVSYFDEGHEVVFGCLEHMLFSYAFYFEMIATGTLVTCKPTLSEADKNSLLADLHDRGYEKMSFGSETHLRLRRGDRLVSVIKQFSGRYLVSLGSPSGLSEVIADITANRLNLSVEMEPRSTLPQARAAQAASDPFGQGR